MAKGLFVSESGRIQDVPPWEIRKDQHVRPFAANEPCSHAQSVSISGPPENRIAEWDLPRTLRVDGVGLCLDCVLDGAIKAGVVTILERT